MATFHIWLLLGFVMQTYGLRRKGETHLLKGDDGPAPNVRMSSSAQNASDQLPHSPTSGGVLLFWAVNSDHRVMDLVKKNIKHARKMYPGRVDVYLAHYDQKKDAWFQRHGSWLSQNVQNSVDIKEGFSKFQMMQELFTKKEDISSYDWVWALDEDSDFTKTNLVQMFEDANSTGSLLVLPSFHESNTYDMQKPQKSCRFRYAPLVEVSFPLIRPAALWELLTSCDHCIHKKTLWGLDNVWCAWSAKKLGHPREQACAILDQTPIIHRNFKSMKGKYENGQRSHDWTVAAMEDKDDVANHHLDEFYNRGGSPKDVKEYSCVQKDGSVLMRKDNSVKDSH